MTERTLFIIRGLPSAGKSTLAERIAPLCNWSMDQSRNVLRGRNDPLVSDFRHVAAFEIDVVEECMRHGQPVIAVHDVNTTREDVTNWALLASQYGYRWSVIHVETDLSDVDLAQRSQTNCPAEAIAKFRARWQPWGA